MKKTINNVMKYSSIVLLIKRDRTRRTIIIYHMQNEITDIIFFSAKYRKKWCAEILNKIDKLQAAECEGI